MERPSREEDCNSLVKNKINGVVSTDSSQTKSPKKFKALQSNSSAVHDRESPPTVDSKSSFNPQALVSKSLSFSNGEPESSIVMKRLKDLCSMKEPTVNVGIEIVGAAYLLKLMTKKPSCDDDHDDDDGIGLAMRQAGHKAVVSCRPPSQQCIATAL